jgi:hypothetical protein
MAMLFPFQEERRLDLSVSEHGRHCATREACE